MTTLARYQFTVTDDEGKVVPGASVTVRVETGGAPLAGLYQDRAGVTPLGNPFAADTEGFVFFHVAGGAYKITVTSGSFTREWRYVAIGTMAELDIDPLLLLNTAALTRAALMNGYITWSVAANVLTVALKTNAGTDPSATDPVYADFRSATQTSGAPSIVAITAALSLTVSVGSKVGFADGINGRLWATLFNNAGTPALGVFNAYGGNAGTPPASAGTIHPLYPSLVASTTAEGGAGAADSAGVHYTTAALTSKAFIVLGHATWETALATAGNWSAAPDVVHQQRLGDKLPGDLVQRQGSFDGAVATGATTTPLDDSIPQNTEGNQFMSLAVTPKSKANILEIEHEANYALSAAAQVIAALHQDSVANALVAKAIKITAAADDCLMRLVHRTLAATVSATTFKVRAGPSSAGTITFNGSAGARLFAGVNFGRLEVVERMG